MGSRQLAAGRGDSTSAAVTMRWDNVALAVTDR